MKSSDMEQQLNYVNFVLIAFLCLVFLLVGVALGQFFLRTVEVKWTDWINAGATVALVIFAFYTWLGAHKTQRLQEQFVWFVGAMESHTDIVSKLLARREGVSVIWWDPDVQAWPQKPKHGDIYKGEIMLSYLPHKFRGHPDNKPIDVESLLRRLGSEKRRVGRKRR